VPLCQQAFVFAVVLLSLVVHFFVASIVLIDFPFQCSPIRYQATRPGKAPEDSTLALVNW